MSRDLKIAVLGAGVVGVNTALRIQQEFPSANLTLIDDKFDETTLSYGPAGIFRPSPNFGGIDAQCAKSIVYESYKFYQQLLVVADSGVTPISGYVFSNTHRDNVQNDLLRDLVPCYRAATADECNLYSKSWTYGSYYETLMTRCTLFLPWALNKYKQQGGTTIKKKVANLRLLQNEYDVVFNCTGLMAKYLCNDPFVVPIRGQILKVYAAQIKHFYYNDSDTYILPLGDRDATVALGGCRNYDSYDSRVSHFDTLSIMQRCSDIVPSLARATISNAWVGLRPHRNVIRLQVQNLDRLKVVHNYGHCGYGITTAPGTADYVVKLFRNSHSTNSKL